MDIGEPTVGNPELLRLVRDRQGFSKQAFIPGGDPSMGGGGGGGAPPAGGDPSGGGGGAPPPADPSASGGGGGGGDPMASLQPMIQSMVQQAMAAQGGGAGGAGAGSGAGGLKPKIDVNVEIMQIKNMLAKMCDHMKIQIPAQDMVATPDKLNAMAQGQSPATPADPNAGGGGAIGGIPPMDPMQGSGAPGGAKTAAHRDGVAFDPGVFRKTASRAQAIANLRRGRRS